MRRQCTALFEDTVTVDRIIRQAAVASTEFGMLCVGQVRLRQVISSKPASDLHLRISASAAPCNRRLQPARSSCMTRKAVANAGHVATASTPAEQLKRAKGYPYPRPPCSFILIAGETYLLPQGLTAASLDPHHLQQQTVIHYPTGTLHRLQDALGKAGVAVLPPAASYQRVLAIGSNAAPEQLLRKYPPTEYPDAVIPVLQCIVQDHDVTYSPLISSYGSCTASLMSSPGTCVEIYSTYLTQPLLQRMHETEGGYDLVHLDCCITEGVCLEAYRAQRAVHSNSNGILLQQQQQEQVMVYIQKHGTLQLPVKGRGLVPILAAEIPALDRRGLPLSQLQTQAAIRAATQQQQVMTDGAPAAAGPGNRTRSAVKPGSSGAAPAAAPALQLVDVGSWGVSGNPLGAAGAATGGGDGTTAAAGATTTSTPEPAAPAAAGFASLGEGSSDPLTSADEQYTLAGAAEGQQGSGGAGAAPMDWSYAYDSAAGAVLADTGGLDEWILNNVADKERRRVIYLQLSAAALPFSQA